MELTPVTPVPLTLTPTITTPTGDPFADMRRAYPAFKNIRDNFATFALLKEEFLDA